MHVFVLEEQHVRVRAVLPELLHVLKPGAVAHCGDKGPGVTHHREGSACGEGGAGLPALGRLPSLLLPGAATQEGKAELLAAGRAPPASPSGQVCPADSPQPRASLAAPMT